MPASAAMSMPVCGLRGSLLNTRREPYELERIPGTGGSRRSVAGAAAEKWRRRRGCAAARLLTRARSLARTGPPCPAPPSGCCTVYCLSATSKLERSCPARSAVVQRAPRARPRRLRQRDADHGDPVVGRRRSTSTRRSSKVTRGALPGGRGDRERSPPRRARAPPAAARRPPAIAWRARAPASASSTHVPQGQRRGLARAHCFFGGDAGREACRARAAPRSAARSRPRRRR